MHQLAVGSNREYFADGSVWHRRKPRLNVGRGLLVWLLVVGGERGLGAVGVAGSSWVGKAWQDSSWSWVGRLERTMETAYEQIRQKCERNGKKASQVILKFKVASWLLIIRNIVHVYTANVQ